jgi:hypothetical protein
LSTSSRRNVEEEDRIPGSGSLEAFDDAAGQRADVGPPVTPDVRLVSSAAE